MIQMSIIHIIYQVECHGELDFQYMLCYQHSRPLNTHSDFSERGSVIELVPVELAFRKAWLQYNQARRWMMFKSLSLIGME